ncbi:MAG: hypothetical protein ACKOD5_07860 [Chthoniobacterales bacterium]
MKLFAANSRHLLIAVIFLGGCAAVPVDGDAVECDRCQTMWIRLYAKTSAPGFYRLDEREGKASPCARCEQLSVQFFESGALLRRCADCGGMLEPRTVNIIR